MKLPRLLSYFLIVTPGVVRASLTGFSTVKSILGLTNKLGARRSYALAASSA